MKLSLDKENQSITSYNSTLLRPTSNDIILGRVFKVTPQQTRVQLLSVLKDDVPYPLAHHFKGIISKQHVRISNVDSVEMHKCFRVGDLVRGKVLNQYDKSYYLLSTAHNNFGVIHAKNQRGEVMIPVDWMTMKGVDSGIEERRKVAKPMT